MTTKKWVLIVLVGAFAVYLVWAFAIQKPANAKTTGAIAKPPATAYAVTQGNWTFYANSYQQQGNSVVLSDFYAMVKGQWKHQTATTILTDKPRITSDDIKIRRLTR